MTSTMSGVLAGVMWASSAAATPKDVMAIYFGDWHVDPDMVRALGESHPPPAPTAPPHNGQRDSGGGVATEH